MKEGGAETHNHNAPEDKFAEYVRGNTWELPTDLRVENSATEEFLKRLTAAGWSEGDIGLLGLGFEEAIVNAIGHGNLGIQGIQGREEFLKEILARQAQAPPDMKVKVELYITPEEARVVVRDQGAGFDWKSVPNPTDQEQLLQAAGRGIFYMRSFFDTVAYNEKGNEVTLAKRREKAGGEPQK